MERKTEEDLVMRTWKMGVSGHRKIERPKQLRWSCLVLSCGEMLHKKTWKRPEHGEKQILEKELGE